MKTIWICFIFSLIALTLKGQNTLGLYPIKVNNRWGCIDSTGRIIIQPHYDFIGNSNQQGLIIAQKSGMLGIINLKEEVILPFEFVNFEWLSDSLIALTKEKKQWAVFHLKKGYVTDFSYDKIIPFSRTSSLCSVRSLQIELYLLYQKEKIALLNSSGVLLFPPTFTYLHIFDSNLILTHIGGLNGCTTNLFRRQLV